MIWISVEAVPLAASGMSDTIKVIGILEPWIAGRGRCAGTSLSRRFESLFGAPSPTLGSPCMARGNGALLQDDLSAPGRVRRHGDDSAHAGHVVNARAGML
jgi:hypothetical protein